MRIKEILLEYAEKQSVNSLGRPIAQTSVGILNFWKWFKGSKVVNSLKQPLVLYHGTKDDFNSFSPDLVNSNTGTNFSGTSAYFFTNCTDTALSYAGQKTESFGLPPHLKSEYADIIATKDYEKADEYFRQNAVRNQKTYADGGNVKLFYLNMKKPLIVNARKASWSEIPFEYDWWSINDLMARAKKLGHDGMIVKNVLDRQEGKGEPSTVYIVYQPSQIKSALGNSGAFGGNNLIDEVSHS